MSTYQFRQTSGASAQSPLVFLFHGTGGDENQFFDFAGDLLPGARRVAPRGDVSEGGALRFFRRTGEGVYDMADLALRTKAMVEFVRERADESQAASVIGLGYSNGANILAAVQFAAPDLFDRTILMHPLIPFEPAATRFDGKSVLITAGQRDPIAPAAATQRLADYFEGNGAAVTLDWHGGGHEIRPEEVDAMRRFLSA